MRAWLAVVVVLGLTACEEQNAQLMVVVDTDYEVPTELDRVVFLAVGANSNDQPSMVTAELRGELGEDLPLTLGLVPSSDTVDQIAVTVQGFAPGSDAPLVERRAVVSFIEGQILTLTMHLVRSCAADPCEDQEGTTCTEFEVQCQPEGRSDLKPWGGRAPELEETQFVPDAGTEGSDGGGPPGGPDGGAPAEELGRVVQVAAGANFTCARYSGGAVYCWGDNGHGQLGDGTIDHGQTCGTAPRDCNPAPVRVSGVDDATDITVGDDFGCVIRQDTQALCWGDNGWGQLGNWEGGTEAVVTEPALVLQVIDGAPGQPLSGVQEISAGESFMCLRATDLNLACAGEHTAEQTGLNGMGTFSNDGVRVATVVGNETVLQIAAGAKHTCVQFPASVQCWGNNDSAQTSSTNVFEEAVEPLPQEVNLAPITVLECGRNHCCALLTPSAPEFQNCKCWGADSFGQLGRGNIAPDCFATVGHSCRANTDYVFASAPVAGQDFIDLALGGEHSCAILEDRTVACWGRNDALQLGRDNDQQSLTPDVVAGVADVVSLSAGKGHTCAVTEAGDVLCWGSNQIGQLGVPLGTTTGTATPVVVPLPR